MKTSAEIIYQHKDTFHEPPDISPPVQVKHKKLKFLHYFIYQHKQH